MKESDKLKALAMFKKHVTYSDGFWFLHGKLSNELSIREYIRNNLTILEKDITDFLSELSYNKSNIDIDNYFVKEIESKAKRGKSFYFASLDELYPNNKFRQIMNYYLFHPDCFCFILIGYGQTGKTTFVSLISKIIGEAYFGRANVGLLRNGHGTAILEGKKLFEVAEAQDLDLDTANTLKSLITNDDIYINPKFQLPRTIKPHVKMVMTCNNMPRFKVTDDGIIRRFIIIEMNNKIKKQDRNFLKDIEEDIPYIIYEAMQHPFDIKDFADEQYKIFENDPQFGFGYGDPNFMYRGNNPFEKYQEYCKTFGYHARNKMNFDKFVELAKIYGGRRKCVTILNDALVKSGQISLPFSETEDLDF